MKLYYMELVPNGAKVYMCEDYDRHKIWVDHPNAKEISKKQFEQLQQLISETNKKNESDKK